MRYLVILALSGGCTLQLGGDDTNAPPGAAMPDAAAPDAGTPGPPSEPLCGSPLATTAPPSIRVDGTVQVIMGTADDTTVEVWRRGDTHPLARAITASTFSLTALTGGLPVDGYVHAAHPGSMDDYYFPAAPFAENTSLSALPLVSPDTFAFVAPKQPNTGTVMLVMHDCTDGTAVRGASVTIAPAGSSTIRYVDQQGMLQSAPTATSSGAVITNVPPGAITIETAGGTKLLRTGHVDVFVNSVSVVDLMPQ